MNEILSQDYSDCEGRYSFYNATSKMNSLSNLVYVDTQRNTLSLIGDASFEDAELVEDVLASIVDTNTNSFVLSRVKESRLDSNYFFNRFKQFYKGIPVQDGGYSELIIKPDNEHPCPKTVVLLYPYMFTGIDIDVSNIFTENDVIQLFADSANFNLNDIELVIEYNLLGQCNFELMYKMHYSTDESYITWIDAHTLSISLTKSGQVHKNAPTENHGVQDMEDSPLNQNTTWLVSPNSEVRTHDFSGLGIPPNISFYNDLQIPTSPILNDWTIAHAPRSVFQAHWMVQRARNAYATILGIDYQNIHVAANCNEFNAFALGTSSLDESYIGFGRLPVNLSTLAELDVVAHEMGHVYLFDTLNPTRTSSGSLHEGISDMFGTFIETQLEVGIDWIMGDNIPLLVRDLQNPKFDCFDDVESLTDVHARSTPLGHWFQLISTQCVDMATALDIVIDALETVPGDADYDDLMNSTLSIVSKLSGNCSGRMQCVAARREDICVNTGYNYYDECIVQISDPNQVCEEDDLATFCVVNNDNASHHEFTLLGKNALYFSSEAGMQGNSQTGPNKCFKIHTFPQLPYYPQTYQIYYYSPMNGKRAYHRFKLIDCLGDDPTCEEYYYGSRIVSEIVENDDISITESEIKSYRIYDIMGRLIVAGSGKKTVVQLANGLYIVAYFNEEGQLISSKKEMIVK